MTVASEEPRGYRWEQAASIGKDTRNADTTEQLGSRAIFESSPRLESPRAAHQRTLHHVCPLVRPHSRCTMLVLSSLYSGRMSNFVALFCGLSGVMSNQYQRGTRPRNYIIISQERPRPTNDRDNGATSHTYQ